MVDTPRLTRKETFARSEALLHHLLLPLLPALLLASLLVSSGCGGKTIDTLPADEALLNQMAALRSGEVGHALLVSRSGVSAALPIGAYTTRPPDLPVRGIFRLDHRLVDSWSWETDTPVETDPGALAVQRPDFVQRPVQGIGIEQITLDPELPAGVIRLSEGKGKEVRFTPWVDMRLVNEPSVNLDCQYDPRLKVLLCRLPDSPLLLAFASNGAFVEAKQERRVEYHSGFGPLEAVSTPISPGFFHFRRVKGATVSFAVGVDEEVVARLARQTLKERAGVEKRARDRALVALDRTALRSVDPMLTGSAAWDIWWVSEGLLVDWATGSGRMTRPPLPYHGDPVADANSLPALLMLAPTDLTPSERILEVLDETLAFSDREGYVHALSRLAGDRYLSSWLFNDSARIAHTRLLADYALDPRFGEDAFDPDMHSRWELDLQGAGLSASRSSTFSGLHRQFDDAMASVATPLRRRGVRNEIMEQLVRYHQVIKEEKVDLVDPILIRPPATWTPENLAAYQSAASDPRISLAWFERHRTGSSAQYDQAMADMAVRLWGTEGGLAFHADESFRHVAFLAPMYHAFRLQVRRERMLTDQMRSAILTPAYHSWESTDRSGLSPFRGGAVVDLEVAASRFTFLLEDLIGLEWKVSSRPAGRSENRDASPVVTGFSLNPAGPREFWQERRTSLVIGQEPARIGIEMDPFEGVYRFQLFGEGTSMQVDLIDIPLESVRLIGTFLLHPGQTVTLTREIGGSGQTTLFINGVEMGQVSRQMVRG